jgi:hypothetical protein
VIVPCSLNGVNGYTVAVITVCSYLEASYGDRCSEHYLRDWWFVSGLPDFSLWNIPKRGKTENMFLVTENMILVTENMNLVTETALVRWDDKHRFAFKVTIVFFDRGAAATVEC